MNDQQFIPCPAADCSGKIPFDPNELLRGVSFVCPKCHASVALASESMEVVQQTINKFEMIKKKLTKSKIDKV